MGAVSASPGGLGEGSPQGEECEFTTTFAHLGLSTTVMEGRLDMDHDLLTTSSSHQLQAEAAISFLQLTAK